MGNISLNRKVRYEYFILDEYDAGIVLTGAEVKSIRKGDVSIIDSFVHIDGNSAWIKNMKITRYKHSHASEKHEENRDKKLLLTKKQISKIHKSLITKGITCVPVSLFTSRNRIKVKIAIVKGKKLWDKKNTIKEKDIKREMNRELSNR